MSYFFGAIRKNYKLKTICIFFVILICLSYTYISLVNVLSVERLSDITVEQKNIYSKNVIQICDLLN